MGAIGRWIEERCREEPDVMQRVLNRKFGDLSCYVTHDKKCGCLVGSYWLEAHLTSNQTEGIDADIGMKVHELEGWAGDGFFDRQDRWEKRSQALIVRLIKQRIRKALGLAPAIHHEEEEAACHCSP